VTFTELMDVIARAFEAVGVLTLIIGGLHAFVFSWREGRSGTGFYPVMRQRFGRTLLLGLEILVAADIIKTVAVETTLESVTTLAVLVVVRVLLSFSLDVEIDGVVPWRRLATSGRRDGAAGSGGGGGG
jgi:uncharacterized membrane protein